MPPLAGERWYEVPKGERVVVSQWSRSAARVQKVQKVLPACSGQVQRVVVRRLSGDEGSVKSFV